MSVEPPEPRKEPPPPPLPTITVVDEGVAEVVLDITVVRLESLQRKGRNECETSVPRRQILQR